VLDLGLPELDGKEVLWEARGFSKVPIIVFVRARSLSEKNLSLNASADVCLERPFRVGELMARQRVA
jgi:two-component system KDP operon response regulator KdpE